MNASLCTSSLGLCFVLLSCAATSASPPAAPPSPGAPPTCAPASPVSREATSTVASSTSTATPDLTLAQAPAAPTPTNAPSSLATGFDCHSTAEHKREESLREWASGGPFGAAWNIEGWPLECGAHFEVPCDATLHLQLFANARVLKAETLLVKHGTVEWRVEIPDERWSPALNSQGLVFQTLVLTLAGVLVCEADGEHLPFADAFIAGISGGE